MYISTKGGSDSSSVRGLPTEEFGPKNMDGESEPPCREMSTVDHEPLIASLLPNIPSKILRDRILSQRCKTKI